MDELFGERRCEDRATPGGLAPIALAFEGGLIFVALTVGWLVAHWPLPGVGGRWADWPGQAAAVAWGAVATVPLLGGLFLLESLPLAPLRRLKRTVYQDIVPHLQDWTIPQKALISVAAGCGEEMLFRGLIQDGLADWIGAPWGLAVGLAAASLLFGVCHWVSGTYAVLAALVGAYLGCLLSATGNLLTPIAAHALYDFIALVYLTRGTGMADGGNPPGSEPAAVAEAEPPHSPEG